MHASTSRVIASIALVATVAGCALDIAATPSAVPPTGPTPSVSVAPKPTITATPTRSAPSPTPTPTPTRDVVRTWERVGDLTEPRTSHSATLLQDGRVLVAGGGDLDGTALATAEVYDPATRTWSATGSMEAGRMSHTATLLDDGRVLVAGGVDADYRHVASAELYDPVTSTWAVTDGMADVRANHTASLLLDGTVLVVGGAVDLDGHMVIASAERFDPARGSWTSVGSLSAARQAHTATVLADGTVLVSGGIGVFVSPVDSVALASVEHFELGRGRWATVASLAQPRFGHSANLLQDGRVLLASGTAGSGIMLPSAELYDRARDSWASTGDVILPRQGHRSVTLTDGSSLIVGGDTVEGRPLGAVESFRDATGSWVAVEPMATPRSGHTVTILADGSVLVAGGRGGESTSELYGPGSASTPRSTAASRGLSRTGQ